MELAERVRFITHRGVRICITDLTGLSSYDEIQAVLRSAGLVIGTQPPGSVRSLVDAHGLPYTLDIVRAVRAAEIENSPHLKVRAFVGVGSDWMAAVHVLEMLTEIPIAMFETRGKAMEFLAEID